MGGKDNRSIHKPKRRRDVLDEDDDWITNLARQQHSTSSATTTTSSTPAPTKQERIQKRLAKKHRREERRQTKRGDARSNNKTKESASADETPAARRTADEAPPESGSTSRTVINSNSARCREPNDTTPLLRILAQRIQECVEKKNPRAAPPDDDAVAGGAASNKNNAPKKRWSKPYSPADPSHLPKKKKRPLAQVVQPRRCDYGGIGLARESLYIDLLDPSCQPRLEQEFREHVPGFFGKQRTKAMKKQLDGQMLWRQLLQQKQEQQRNSTSSRKKKKKSKRLSADERVHGMLKSGEI